MRARVLVLVLALGALAVAALPASEGHAGSSGEVQLVRFRSYAAQFDLAPAPVYAGDTASVLLTIYTNKTYEPLRGAAVRMTLDGPDPALRGTELNMTETGFATYSRLVPFKEPGNYTATFTVSASGGAPEPAKVTFRVYPNLPVRIVAADDVHSGYVTNTTVELAFFTMDPRTTAPVHGPSDLRIRIERWSTDHTKSLSVEELPLTYTVPGSGQGLWKTDYVFRSAHMHHLQFASTDGKFGYNDSPMIMTGAYDLPATAAGGTNDTPAPSPALAAAALGLAATLGLAGRRRRG